MILQALVEYYEALAARGGVSRPGWGKTRVSYALELDETGTLRRVVPLMSPSADGKKMLAREMELPTPVKRTAGIASDFLWDNAGYLLGIDGKDKPERAKQCFDAVKELHLGLLSETDDPFALAICRFFESWQPTPESPLLAESWDVIKKGGFRRHGEGGQGKWLNRSKIAMSLSFCSMWNVGIQMGTPTWAICRASTRRPISVWLPTCA